MRCMWFSENVLSSFALITLSQEANGNSLKNIGALYLVYKLFTLWYLTVIHKICQYQHSQFEWMYHRDRTFHVTSKHFLWLFYELCHKDFNYILSSCVRKMHDKYNKIQVFALLSCPSMCHVFLICLWNYDYFALCIPHGCHLQFSIQSWTAGMMHLTLSLALVFSYSLSLSLFLSLLTL